MAEATTSSPSGGELAAGVLQALGADAGATVAELAATLGRGRSTVSKALVALEREGRVRREPGGRAGAARLPDRWHLASADATPEPPAAATVPGTDGALAAADAAGDPAEP